VEKYILCELVVMFMRHVYPIIFLNRRWNYSGTLYTFNLHIAIGHYVLHF